MCHAPAHQQAEKAVRTYGVHAVVANELHTRKDRVTIVRPNDEHNGFSFEHELVQRDPDSGEPIERDLVAAIVTWHKGRMNKHC